MRAMALGRGRDARRPPSHPRRRAWLHPWFSVARLAAFGQRYGPECVQTSPCDEVAPGAKRGWKDLRGAYREQESTPCRQRD